MKKLATNLIAIIVTLNIIITDAYARAGGGHSSGGGRSSSGRRSSFGGHSSSFDLWIIKILILCLVVYLAWRIIFKLIKNINSKQISKVDKTELLYFLNNGNVTGEYDFSKRVKEVYFEVQRSWSERKVSLMEGYVSEKLFEEHQKKINNMIKDNKRNVLKRVKLNASEIIRISKDKEIDKAFVEVKIYGSMIDYWIDENKPEAIKPNKESKSFSEIWTFVIRDNKWVLHKITQR